MFLMSLEFLFFVNELTLNRLNIQQSCHNRLFSEMKANGKRINLFKVKLSTIRIKPLTLLQSVPCACASEILCVCLEKWMTKRSGCCMEGKMPS